MTRAAIQQPHGETSHSEVIARLQTRISEALGPVCDSIAAAPYCLLDFPDHSNVGDSAIYGGERSWLNRHTSRGPALVEPASQETVGPAGGAIFLHGGGNFGDIYPRHQDYRMAILRDNPASTIVQMPQSIHFDDAAAIEHTAKAIAAHGDFTLLTRDHESYALSERHFDCNVRMCPDMAFALGEIPRPVSPERDVLLLLREDKERTSSLQVPTLPRDWRVVDWITDPETTYPSALRSARTLALRTGNPLNLRQSARRIAYFDALAEQRTQRGLHLLSSARYVITDRLHAHILCTLLGIPHAFLDNYYGKIARFSNAWATAWQGVTKADGIETAIGAAEDWLAANGGTAETGAHLTSAHKG